MSEYTSDKMSLGAGHSKKVILGAQPPHSNDSKIKTLTPKMVRPFNSMSASINKRLFGEPPQMLVMYYLHVVPAAHSGLVSQNDTDEYEETYFRKLRETLFCCKSVPKEIQDASAICELSSCEWALPTSWW